MPSFAALARTMLGLTLVVSGCGDTNDPQPVTLAGSGRTLAISVFGGFFPYTTTTFVDSTTGKWEKTRCPLTASVSPCRGTEVVATGVAPASQVRDLFSALRAPDFLALPVEIPGGAGPEVDGQMYQLHVIAQVPRQLVQWRTDAPLPAALTRVLVRLDAATGAMWR